MHINILLTGDIHIGKRSSAVVDNSPFMASRYTWEQIVAYAIGREIDIVALTGDIIDRDNRYFEALNPLQKGLKALNDKGIKVFIVAGNHDFDVLAEVIAQEPIPNVHLLGQHGRWEPFIYRKDDSLIQFLGWSFASRHYPDNPVDRLDELLIEKDIPTIALLHGDIYNPLESRYAPINKASLRNRAGIDAWLLGHIHRPDIIEPQHPLILYPGSPHALNPKEEGRHGPFILMVKGKKIDVRQEAFSPVRFETKAIDISEANDKEAVRSLIVNQLNTCISELSDDERLRYLVYDIILTGSYDNIDELNELKKELADFESSSSFNVLIRRTDVDIKPKIRIEELVNDPSYIGVLATAILLLEKGESNPFTGQMIKEWINQYRALSVNNSTYAPLEKKFEKEDLPAKARQAVLAECRKLITELAYMKTHEV